MDDSVFPPNTMFGNPSESMLDLGYMDGLLFDGCWLQATDGSEFNNNNDDNNNNPIFDPSYLWPTLEYDQERQKPSFINNLSITQTEEQDSSITHVTNPLEYDNQPANFPIQGSEMSGRWWIGPRSNLGPSFSVMERLLYAIENIKLYTPHKNTLIQVWLPENREGKKVLSTSTKLSLFDLNCPRLSNYRNISENYHFAAEGDSKDVVGLPGRVFMGKVPEWTPDVQFFRKEEYPRVLHAKQCDVRGSVAVPIFDQGSRTCIGVIEVVMTAQKSNYSTEIESVCKALEDVDLRSSDSSSNPQKFKVSDDSYRAALPEIIEILKTACETHNLPLAQTWVPCIQQGKDGSRHSDDNLILCISTVDSACFVNDPRFKDFQQACSEHHLLKGQGVVGQAFTKNQPCYSPDVKTYTKTEYPLSHHARIFNLCGVVAIRLRSMFLVSTDYVLEFFLPVECRDQEEQKQLLNSLSDVIQNVCQSLRVVTDAELLEESVAGSNREEVLKVEEILSENPADLAGKQPDSGLVDGHKRPERKRGGTKTEKTITLQMLRQYFAGSLKDAAKHIGVCPTTLKRICRQHGIQRWPSRKIKKVGHSLQKIQLVMDSVQGASGSFQLESFYSNFPKLDPKPTSIIDSKTATKSSSSQTSSSGQSCSTGSHPYRRASEVSAKDSGDRALKRARSDAELLVSNGQNSQDQEPNVVIQQSHSHKSLTELQVTGKLPPKSVNDNLRRVKVTFGEENARFRLQKDWGYAKVMEEIAKRFGINDINEFHLKYFDDDSEWVLLTCDADLEECVDVYKSSNGGTIKLALFEPQLLVGSSLGSNLVL